MSSRLRQRLRGVAVGAGVALLALAGCSQGSATRDSTVDGVTTIQVAVQTAPYADYFTQLQTAIAGGTAPDTFELDYGDFVTYADAGSLADLAGPAGHDSGWQPSLLSPAAMQAFTRNGRQYALPESFSTVVLL